MPALVQREVTPAWVGVGVVLFKAIFDVIGLGLDSHPHAHADVIRNFATIGL